MATQPSTGDNKNLVRINLDEPRYDQSTFIGRLRHFLDVTDMRLVLTSSSKLDESLKLLKDYEDKGRPPVTPEEAEKIWEAKKVKDGIVHPDTGKNIPLPVRFSAFVPMNIIIVAGMLTPNPTIAATVFWQWVNQSYNVALNHAYRNASNPMSFESIAKSYAAAVAISCSVAVGLGQVVKRSTGFSPGVRTVIQRAIPYTAVATAGIANVFLMRWNETQEGIIVKDAQGNDLGKSKKAGFYALSQVALSRCVLPLPILTLPPILMSVLEKSNTIKNNKYANTAANLGVIGFCLWAALPLAIAIFPQYVEVDPKRLESEFHNLKDKSGKPITSIYFNKGL